MKRINETFDKKKKKAKKYVPGFCFWLKEVELSYDDLPVCEPVLINNLQGRSELSYEYNLFDSKNKIHRYITLTELYKADNKEKWEAVKEKIRKCDSIAIVNDMQVKNKQLAPGIIFNMWAFFAALKNVNPNCFIFDEHNKAYTREGYAVLTEQS